MSAGLLKAFAAVTLAAGVGVGLLGRPSQSACIEDLDMPSSVDLGTQRFDALVPYSFEVRNKGTRALMIERVFSDCGCTSTIKGGFTLAPGESKVCSGEFHLVESGEAQEYTSRVSVLIKSDGPESRRIKRTKLRTLVTDPIVMLKSEAEHGECRKFKISESYRGVVQRVDVYPHGSDRVVSAVVDLAEMSISLTEPTLPENVDVVMELRPADPRDFVSKVPVTVSTRW